MAINNPDVPRIVAFEDVDDDDDGFVPYINNKIIRGIMTNLPSSVLKGMKTAAFRRMVNLLLRLFRTFSANESGRYPVKEMYVYGGYLRRTIVTKAAAERAIAAFERDNGMIDNHFHVDEEKNPILWCTKMFMDPNMDVDFYFECFAQNNRFIEYLREFFDVMIMESPDNEYPSNQMVRSYRVTSRLLDPLDIRLKVDVTTGTEDVPMFPDFTVNQLRQTPGGSMYMAESKYYNYERGFSPRTHMTTRYSMDGKEAILMRTMVEIENGITRLLLVPLRWFKTKAATKYMQTLLEDQSNENNDERVCKAYTKYLRQVFNRLPKTLGFKVMNFESSVQYHENCKYTVRCCHMNQLINSDTVGQHNGNIVVECVQCTKKMVVFTDFLNMIYDH